MKLQGKDPRDAVYGLVCKPGLPRITKVAAEVLAFFRDQGLEHQLEERVAMELGEPGMPLGQMDPDLYVSIGGDGTILRTLQHTEAPLYAVNSGAVGFLAEVEPKFVTSGLRRILDGDFFVEERLRFKVLLDGERIPDAANEVTVQSAKIAKMIKFQLHIDSELMDTIRGDGVVVATATGSTGYAMSLGGPILDPTIDAAVIVPIAPFRMANRPVIVPADKNVIVTVMRRESDFQDKDVKVVVDGQHGFGMQTGGEVRVSRSERKSRFVRFGGGFYERVRTKLVR
ncbi:MAG: NAD(+)/NADH kinase [Euryarchaeota archaeon]|nr:NAD(+)/NADH kinase [Euryarchaeota archaeon]